MTNKSQSVVFFGNEQLSSTRQPSACHSFRALIDNGYHIELLIIKDSPQKTRKHRQQPIVEIAKQHNIAVARVLNKEELERAVANTQSTVGVLAAFGMIVKPIVIKHFKHGIVNIHPSLLPQYRGTTPIETAILQGSDKTGVSIMQLTEGMDSGPVYAQAEFALSGGQSKAELTDKLGALGAKLLIQVLAEVLNGTAKPVNQDESEASYTKMLSKDDAALDFTKPAAELERQIRAYLDWPGSKAVIGNAEVTITAAHAVPSNDPRYKPGDHWFEQNTGVLAVEAAEGYVCIERLKPAGKGEMTAADFINGYLAV